MRDHRSDAPVPAPNLIDITRQVREHATRHPGSVKRSTKAAARARAKRAATSRKVNRR